MPDRNIAANQSLIRTGWRLRSDELIFWFVLVFFGFLPVALGTGLLGLQIFAR